MIITRKYAKHLINAGKAQPITSVTTDTGKMYMCLRRPDIQRTDHFKATDRDIQNFKGVTK